MSTAVNREPMHILINVLVSELSAKGIKFIFENGRVPLIRTESGIRISCFEQKNVVDYIPEKFYVRNNGYTSYMSYNEVYELIIASEEADIYGNV